MSSIVSTFKRRFTIQCVELDMKTGNSFHLSSHLKYFGERKLNQLRLKCEGHFEGSFPDMSLQKHYGPNYGI